MADAADLKSVGSNTVRVRPPPRPQIIRVDLRFLVSGNPRHFHRNTPTLLKLNLYSKNYNFLYNCVSIMKKVITGINGFGRFGQHLLKYWLERDDAQFIISFINDDFLSVKTAVNLLESDPDLDFRKFGVKFEGQTISLTGKSGRTHHIQYTNSKYENIDWMRKAEIFLECSGKNTNAEKCKLFLQGNTQLVVISATSENPGATLIFGYNHNNFDKKNHRIVSYGSCTVNAYVPLAAYLYDMYGVSDSDVNVIHGIPKYKFPELNTLTRKLCTLELSGKRLLTFLNDENFAVNYTLVPHTGVSIIDYRFRLNKKTSKADFIGNLEKAINGGVLVGLYGLEEMDGGPDKHKFTTNSAVIIKSSIKMLGNNVYFQAYFDNENSVNRYFDLVSFVVERMKNKDEE